MLDSGLKVYVMILRQQKHMGENIGGFILQGLPFLGIRQTTFPAHTCQVHIGLNQFTDFLLQFQDEPVICAFLSRESL